MTNPLSWPKMGNMNTEVTREDIETLKRVIDRLSESVVLHGSEIAGLHRDRAALHEELHGLKMALVWTLNTLTPEMQLTLRKKLADQQQRESENPIAAEVLQLCAGFLVKEPPTPPRLYIVPKPKNQG